MARNQGTEEIGGGVMGKFDFEIPTDFIKQLGKLADVDRIAPQMIDEGYPILKKC